MEDTIPNNTNLPQQEKTSTSPLVDAALAAANKLEAANRATEQLLKKQEELLTRQILSGKSEAGTSQPKEKSKEEQINEEADAWMKKAGLSK